MDSEVDADIKTLVLPASTTISTFGATVVDDADAGAVRTTIDAARAMLSGAGAPGVATGNGYPLGTTYADTTGDVGYILVDATVGVNVWWTGGAGGGGGGSTQLALNELVQLDATEVVIGGGYIDGSTGGTYSWEIQGIYNDNGGTGNQDMEIRLYDRGPDATPVAGVLRSVLEVISLDTLDTISLTLTATGSPGTDTDTIHDSARMYEVRLYMDAGGALDSGFLHSCTFIEA